MFADTSKRHVLSEDGQPESVFVDRVDLIRQRFVDGDVDGGHRDVGRSLGP